jgi:type IV pilus assembly protein PilO
MRFGWREFVFLFVLVAMPVSSYWFVFRPQNEEIQTAKKEIEHKELMLERLSEATAQRTSLEEENEQIASAIDLVEGRLPDDKEVEVILEQVAELARKSRLLLPKVKTQKPVAAARYMEQPIEMEMRGDFDRFYAFLLKLEKLDRITRMLDLELERVDQEDGFMTATFTLSIYFQPQAAEVS